MYDYDEEALRREIIDYIETEMYLNPVAGIDLYEAEHGDIDDLIELARKCGIDTDKYR